MSLCLIGSLTACAATDPIIITEHTTDTVYVDRYVPVPAELTEPLPLWEFGSDISTLDLRTGYLVTRTRLDQCNSRLAEIAAIIQP